MKILFTILQNLTFNIYTQYESKDFLLTKLILSFCCHGNPPPPKKKNKINIMENYHKKDFLVILFDTFQQNLTKKVSMSSSQ